MNSLRKTVSVIVPAYNAEKTVGRCIDGLLKQTHKPTEIIIIDDGSTDCTGLILDQYSSVNDNIVVIHQENAGVSAARNRGLEAAVSDCIVFADSDDAVGENYVATLMQYADYDFVTCGFHLQNPMLVWEDIVFADEGKEIDIVRQSPSNYIGKYYFGSPWAKMYKKAILDKIGLRFSLEIHNGEDTLFNFSYLFATNNIRIVPQCDYYYYYQKMSLSHSRYSEAWKWRITQERVINQFFNCSAPEEVVFKLNREFGVLQQLLRENIRGWTNQQIRDLYHEPLFQNSIQYKNSSGSLEEKLLLFALEHNIYKIYEAYLLVRKYGRRGINHFKRRFYKRNRL